MEGKGPVSLADAEVAAGIARAAQKGRGADRQPTLEQLLAAFGEHEPTEAARRRVRSALEMADVRVKPDLLVAPPGQRVLLQVAGASGGSGASRALAGLLALAGVLAVAVLAATIAGQGDGDTAGESLPEAPPTTATVAGGAASGTTPVTTETETTPPEDEAASTTEQEDEPTAAERRRARARQERRERERRRRAAAGRRVSVKLVASQPTFLCVEDEDGEQLYAATLTGEQTFRGDDLRFNLGLGSTTTVTVDGKRYPTSESPTGFRVTRSGTTPLALGERPC